ncbi:MAG: L-threonylcarbamoyladenylate synthase [Spirochaetaceae bacterium]
MDKIGSDITKAGNIIKNGGLVIFPTETVYGLGANALDENAVKNIFLVKERPTYDPLIVHIDSIDKISMVVSDFPEVAQKLAAKFWPGPLTMILPKNDNIPYLVTSNLETVGIRIPNHPVALEFLKQSGLPIAGPSANKFGYISPTQSSHLEPLKDGVDYILEGGECTVGLESTIISLVDSPTILRKGKITKSQIEEIIGEVTERVNSSSKPDAPGMLEKHYAPTTKLEIYSPLKSYTGKIAFLAFADNTPNIQFSKVLNLSSSGSYIEAAEKLYRYLRELDSNGYDLILTSYIKEINIGQAINDKLKRASAE